MCGRFFVDTEDRYFRDLAEKINRSPLMPRFRGKLPANEYGEYGGEIAPTSVVPVLAPNRQGERAVFPMQWGYTLPAQGSGRTPPLMINARTETADVKPLFRDSWRQRRCVIPATAYFEWEHRLGFDGKPQTGRKFRIEPVKGGHTFLAGLYRMEGELPVFVILTRAASQDLFWMHNRMPLLLPEEALDGWLSPTGDPAQAAAAALTETVTHEEKKEELPFFLWGRDG